MRIRNLLSTSGPIPIVASNAFSKAVAFAGTVVVVRLLTKQQYGDFAYAVNLINYFLVFRAFGSTRALMYYGPQASSAEELAGETLATLRISAITGIILLILVLVFSMLLSLPLPGATLSLAIMAPVPLLFSFAEIPLSVLRIRRRNVAFAVGNVTVGIAMLVGTAVGSFYGATGASLGRSVALVLVALLLYMLPVSCPPLSTHTTNRASSQNSRRLKYRRLLSYGAHITFSNALSQVLHMIGTTIVGLRIHSSDAVAEYKVASTIPAATVFVSVSIMQYVMPLYARWSGSGQGTRLSEHFMRTWATIAGISIAISGIGFGLSPWILVYLFGPEYQAVSGVQRILFLSLVFTGAIRVPLGNYFASVGYPRINSIVAAIALPINIIGTWYLSGRFGLRGAAWANLATVILSSLVLLGVFGSMKRFSKPPAR